MKVYFTASARGADKFGDEYKEIYHTISKKGHKNLDDVICNVDSDEFYETNHEQRINFYKQTLKNIKLADLLIIDVTIHSFSMGYVLEKGLDLGKPVVALYYQGYKPFFVSGIENENLKLISYHDNNISQVLDEAIEFSKNQMDTRFNFFISPKHQAYLDWIAKKRKIPRSVFLRSLINKEMKKEDRY